MPRVLNGQRGEILGGSEPIVELDDQGRTGKPVSRVIRRGPYPELTLPAIFVGWLIGSLIAISIGYASLILGFSIEGSELAAILGWGILRGLMRRTSIVENNINQTLASAGCNRRTGRDRKRGHTECRRWFG